MEWQLSVVRVEQGSAFLLRCRDGCADPAASRSRFPCTKQGLAAGHAPGRGEGFISLLQLLWSSEVGAKSLMWWTAGLWQVHFEGLFSEGLNPALWCGNTGVSMDRGEGSRHGTTGRPPELLLPPVQNGDGAKSLHRSLEV